MKVRAVLTAGSIAAFLVGIFLFIYYPAVPKSLLGWILLVVVGLPAWMFLEWAGDSVLGARFFKRRSSAGRIFLAVPAVAALMGLATLVVVCVRWVIVSA
ncbi:hypothetical protein [Lysobacter humi (ex Lee et al. 2017)]